MWYENWWVSLSYDWNLDRFALIMWCPMWHVGWLSLNLVGSKGEADRKRIGRSYPQHLSTSQILADFLFGDFVLIFGKRLGLQKKIVWTQVKVRNLFQLEADASGVSALRIEQCKANGLLFSQENSPVWQFFLSQNRKFFVRPGVIPISPANIGNSLKQRAA